MLFSAFHDWYEIHRGVPSWMVPVQMQLCFFGALQNYREVPWWLVPVQTKPCSPYPYNKYRKVPGSPTRGKMSHTSKIVLEESPTHVHAAPRFPGQMPHVTQGVMPTIARRVVFVFFSQTPPSNPDVGSLSCFAHFVRVLLIVRATAPSGLPMGRRVPLVPFFHA